MSPLLSQKTGTCLNCRRILISDVYQLCWTCASVALSSQAPAQERKLTPRTLEQLEEQLYTELGGEAGGA